VNHLAVLARLYVVLRW